MPNWVVEGLIATSPRPGFRPGPEHTVQDGVVEAWVDEAREFGVSSIICLIGADQLWLYRRAVPEGLVQCYRSAGFEVCHIPTADQQTHPFTPEQYEHAWESFQLLPKPVLVHCSAGMDRTGRVVNYILERLAEAAGEAAG
jgi:protein tyrosine phosphatase